MTINPFIFVVVSVPIIAMAGVGVFACLMFHGYFQGLMPVAM